MKQPAKTNYFFKGGYVELWNTITETFENLGYDISEAWDVLADGWVLFWESFFSAVGSIFSLEFEWDDIRDSIKGICIFSFGLGKLIFILIVTTSLSVLLSLMHAVILLTVMAIAYTIFMLLWLSDTIYCLIKHISSNCPNCQDHFSIPVYICPECGVEHTRLRPSKYGIWKRTCECGHKLPTTFFNGREKLEAHCPNCGMNIKDGGKHVDICIPVVGGASSGKTCLIHQSIAAIGIEAENRNLAYEYSPNGLDDYEDNMNSLNNGYLPEKTNDMRLKYYQFYLSPKSSKVKNLISLCDVGGEVYSDSTSLGEQIGYKYANAFLMVVDPLSVMAYREEVEKQGVSPVAYGCSSDSIDSIVSMLISTLENMFCINSKDMLKTDVAVVFSKGDIPGLSDKIGDAAVDRYMQENAGVTRLDAQNAVCESFLMEYEEVNFLNSLKSKFKSIQFFSSSSLGHNADGTPFESQGVVEPLFWLLSKTAGVTADAKVKV
ncbi:MAG: hypothetical protein J6D21_08915 [Clostridia bacterium]|nr:hypothetical protein [Clostridia bacterium]